MARKKERKIRKEEKIKLVSLFFRYFLAIIMGIFIIFFYTIFTPLTFFVLKSLGLFFEVYFYKNFIIYHSTLIEIIPACVAGSAYYLLFLLNILTPNIKIKKRIFALFFAFTAFFLFNFFRLILLISLEFIGVKTYFYHKVLWYFGSTIAVFLIWILTIKIFKIKEIPFYSDFVWLAQKIKK
ncbi:MAG: pacearchaeosortase [Candidatus Pacearchaeota archaeon]